MTCAHLVVTSIHSPNRVLRALADGATAQGWRFTVIGDLASPSDFALADARYLSVDDQRRLGFATAAKLPTRHYARKNIGYLLAIAEGATQVVETDDDNMPRPSFFGERVRCRRVPTVRNGGWVNVYRYYSDSLIWPRGLPLDAVRSDPPSYDTLADESVDCPIQQGLADGNPDVDAVFRLTSELPVAFRADRRVALAPGSWCPFNSQNTTWWPETFPLLYLPSSCSFRSTDIWRSLVAQRIAWASGWSVLFHEATVDQDRNQHDLLTDFEQEIPVYLHARRISDALAELPLPSSPAHLHDSLRICYELLVRIEAIASSELEILDAWLEDVRTLTRSPHP